IVHHAPALRSANNESINEHLIQHSTLLNKWNFWFQVLRRPRHTATKRPVDEFTALLMRPAVTGLAIRAPTRSPSRAELLSYGDPGTCCSLLKLCSTQQPAGSPNPSRRLET